MSELRVQRRGFLVGAGVGLGALGLYGLWRLSPEASTASLGPGENVRAAPIETLDQLILSGQWSPVVGELYLKGLNGEDSDPTTIRSQLDAVLHATNGSEILEKVQLAIAQDFQQGHLCILDRWALSLNECRLSALTYLGAEPDLEELAAGPLSRLIESQLLELQDWGPRTGAPAKPFNIQQDGTSALWFRFSQIEATRYTMFFGEIPMKTTVQPGRDLIIASLAPSQLVPATSSRGKTPITLVDFSGGRKQHLGWFTIQGEAETDVVP